MGEARRRKLASELHDRDTKHYWKVKYGREPTNEEIEFFKKNAQPAPGAPTITEWNEKIRSMLKPDGVGVVLWGDRVHTIRPKKG